jgi:hypothetical protein
MVGSLEHPEEVEFHIQGQDCHGIKTETTQIEVETTGQGANCI